MVDRVNCSSAGYADLADYEREPIITLLCWSRPLSWQDQGDGRTVRLQIYQEICGVVERRVLEDGGWPKVHPPMHTDGYVLCDNYAAALAEANLLILEHALIPAYSVVSSHWVHDVYPRAWHRLTHPVPGEEWPEGVELGDCLTCDGTGVCAWCDGRGKAEIYHNDFCVCDPAVFRPSTVPQPVVGVCVMCQGTRRQPVIDHQYSRALSIDYARKEIRMSLEVRGAAEQRQEMLQWVFHDLEIEEFGEMGE